MTICGLLIWFVKLVCSLEVIVSITLGVIVSITLGVIVFMITVFSTITAFCPLLLFFGFLKDAYYSKSIDKVYQQYCWYGVKDTKSDLLSACNADLYRSCFYT